jgi:class 3 adenylate cyclase/predicted ATPase
VQCPQCQHDNNETAKFCEECGTKLARVCSHCGHQARPTAKFCPECGTSFSQQSTVHGPQPTAGSSRDSGFQTLSPIHWTPPHLADRIRAVQAAMNERGAPNGERKTITALFADIKGSMDLLEDLDPEEARRIIDPALKLMMGAVHRYEGFVAQSTGDGIFALFGAPIAHEDHPHRALYAALKMQDDLRKYAETLRVEKGVNLQIRVGVNTGDVVVRSIRKDDLHTDYVPIGHSSSLAARMESLANGGAIVASEYTYKLTDGYFAFKPLGAAKVKGVTEPLHIYELLGVGPLRTRLQFSAHRGLARLIGRQNEMAQLKRVSTLAREGRGQIVAAIGDAGVGKSRLFHEFKLTAMKDYLVLDTFCVAHGAAQPYLPLIELLKQYFQISAQDDDRSRREKVTGKVLTLDRNLEDTLPHLLSLLGLDESASLTEMDSRVRQQRLLDAIKRLLLRESQNQPLLIIVEDLHWIDSDSQAFLSLFSDSVPATRILLLMNYRPEYQHGWGSKTYYTHLRLDPLGQEDTEAMLRELLGEGWGLEPLKQFILVKTEGNPFFMEELVQALIDQGVLVRGAAGKAPVPVPLFTKPLTEIQLPTTVQGIIAARIDRLDALEKALLQTLAVLGKEFSLLLARHLVDLPEEELLGLLARLRDREFIYERSPFPELEYTFKHVLTQDVAYQSLLNEHRVTLHERAAQTIETLYADRLKDYYSELAYHYTQSRHTEKAVCYLQRAGEHAVHRAAYTEATRHFTMAIELLPTLPDSRERAQQELALYTALGMSLVATRGYGDPEVARVYARARHLAQTVEDSPQLLSAFWIWKFYSVRGEFHIARELAGQFVQLAQNVEDPVFLPPALWALGFTLFRVGEFAAARTRLEQGIALYDPQKHSPERSKVLLMQDPGVGCLSWRAMTLWHLGFPDQALRCSQEAITLASDLAHPSSLAFALHFASLICRLRRDGHAAQEYAEAVIAYAQEHGLSYFSASGSFVRGWALVQQGQRDEGIAQMQQALATWRSVGIEQVGQPSVVLAEAYGQAGRIDDGLQCLHAAAVEMQRSGERYYEAELYRVMGGLTLKQCKVQSAKSQVLNPQAETEAEGYFLRAIDIARRQDAKLPELRAAIGLGRLWKYQRKRTEARHRVEDVYNWFTEGFETVDLQAARTLLDSLASSD